MLRLKIERWLSCTHGTFGVLSGGNFQSTYWTCEEEQQHNRRNISCIPAGTYLCRRTVYHKYGYETFEITGVAGRDRILFHPGNTEEDTEGCVTVGRSIGTLQVVDEDSGQKVRKLAVMASKIAFSVFMDRLAGVDSFLLEITDPEA